MTDLGYQYGLPEQTIQSLKHVFKRHKKIEEVILYGSRAMGSYRKGSDIDLCLQGPNLILRDLLVIENEIDDLLLPWKVDLSLKHTIENTALLDHIRRVGKRFYHELVSLPNLKAAFQLQ